MSDRSDIILGEDTVEIIGGKKSPVVDIEGGNWNLEEGEGDLRIGDNDNNLRISVATGGAGEGTVRIWATSVLRLGVNGDSVFEINESDIEISNKIKLGQNDEIEWNTILDDGENGSITYNGKTIQIEAGDRVDIDSENGAYVRGNLHAHSIESKEGEFTDLVLGDTYPSESIDPGRLSIIDGAAETTIEADGESGEVHARAFNEASDARCKEDIETIEEAMESVKSLRGVSFLWNESKCPGAEEGRDLGLVAQEVEEVLPEAVSQTEEGRYQLSYSSVVPVLVEALKEQQEIIDAQNEQIEEMEKRLQRLERAVDGSEVSSHEDELKTMR